MKTLICMALSLLSSAALSSARALADWPYEELLAKSDLVVIADPMATNTSSDTLEIEGRNSEEYQGLNTQFKSLAPLKGELKQETFTVLHFRYFQSVTVDNGALFVNFRQQELLFEGKLTAKPEKDGMSEASARVSMGFGKPSYLLFLKLRPDGRYEPVTGQYDATMSCRELLQTEALSTLLPSE